MRELLALGFPRRFFRFINREEKFGARIFWGILVKTFLVLTVKKNLAQEFAGEFRTRAVQISMEQCRNYLRGGAGRSCVAEYGRPWLLEQVPIVE